MTRTTYVFRPQHPNADEFGHVTKDEALDWDYAQKDTSAHIISDTMNETRHMADGRIYTSKSAFRKATRAAGCIEYGNEVPHLLTPKKHIELDRRERRDAIKKTIYDLKNGKRT